MTWEIDYLPEARDDLGKLDGSQRIFVQKAIRKVSQNPLSMEEGGYGRPLGNKRTYNLTGLLKIKLRGIGLRVVYKLIREKDQMIIVVIGVREEEEVYELAEKRKEKYDL